MFFQYQLTESLHTNFLFFSFLITAILNIDFIPMRYRNFLTGFVIFLCFCFPVASFSQEMVFSARADASTVGLEDVFRVTFSFQNAPSGISYKPPAFHGFVIKGGPSQSQNQSISIINGKREQSTTIELTYLLQAEQLGNLRIEPLELVVENKSFHTNALNIKVVKGSVLAQNQRQQQRSRSFFDDDLDDFWKQQDAMIQQMMQQMQQMQQSMLGNMPPGMDPRITTDISDLDEKNIKKNVFIKVEVDKTNPYVGEQITAQYKLYTRLNMNMKLTQLPSLNGFWSEDFQIPTPPQPTIEVVNGKKYNVFLLKKSALFPQQAGRLILDPAKAEGQVQVAELDNRSWGGYQIKNVQTEVASVPITIQVKPLPEHHKPKSFTGGVGQFSVKAVLDSNVVNTDNPGSLKFVITGTGNFNLIAQPLTSDFPPALGLSEPVIEDSILSRSPNISGKKTFTYFLSPQEAGTFTIPSFEFSFFDPSTQQYKTLQTSPLSLEVKKGKGSNVVKKERGLMDIHDIEKGALNSKASNVFLWTGWSYWRTYILAFLLFLGAIIFVKQQQKAQADVAGWKNKKANKVAWKRLAKARKLINHQNNALFYEEVAKAIWLYLSDKLAIPMSALSKQNVADKLHVRNVSSPLIEQTHQIIEECEMALYSPAGGQQQRLHVLESTTNLISQLEKELN